jgi:hypothetical protein
MGRRYTLPIPTLVYTGPMEVAAYTAGATMPSKVISAKLSFFGDAGDAQAETLPVELHKGHSVASSGGISVTPVKHAPSDAACAGTFSIRNTTPATGPSIVSIDEDAVNVQQGYVYKPTPEEMHEIGAGNRAVLRLPGTPADVLFGKGVLVIEEDG